MNLQLDVCASSGHKALGRRFAGETPPCAHVGVSDLKPFCISSALPSRFAYYGSKARADLMHAGAALLLEEAGRVARVLEYFKREVLK